MRGACPAVVGLGGPLRRAVDLMEAVRATFRTSNEEDAA